MALGTRHPEYSQPLYKFQDSCTTVFSFGFRDRINNTKLNSDETFSNKKNPFRNTYLGHIISALGGGM